MTTLSNEQLRHRIVELRQQRGSHLIDESDYIEEVMQLFASQRQAILKEVREGVPNKKLPAYRQGRELPPHLLGSESSDYPRIKALKSHNQGFNEAIYQVTNVLDALEKKYKGGEETPKEKI
jgi:hypothetical protein